MHTARTTVLGGLDLGDAASRPYPFHLFTCTQTRFRPSSPESAVPILPDSSPPMPVFKDKVMFPGMSCSPLSPLPQNFLAVKPGSATPPPYITLDSLPSSDAEAQLPQGFGESGRMANGLEHPGAGAARAGRWQHAAADGKSLQGGAGGGAQDGMQWTQMSSFSRRKKDSTQLRNAIQEQMQRLQHLSQNTHLLDEAFVVGSMDLDEEEDSAELSQQPEFAQSRSAQARLHPARPAAATFYHSSNACSAFDASQLDLLQKFIKENGGLKRIF